MAWSVRKFGLALCAVAAATPGLAAQAVLFVDADATGLQNGSSWANAFVALEPALAAASSGTQIRVAEGTYRPTAPSIPGDPRSATFRLKNGVAVVGGYAGFGAPTPDALDAVAHPTLLSGDIGAPGVTADNAFHVVLGSGTNATAILDGFTITQGEANGSFATGQNSGAGLVVTAGNPTIRNCIFTGNHAKDQGGGAVSGSTTLTLSRCTFTDNEVSFQGGGGFAGKGRLVDCTFSGNHSDATGGAVEATDLDVVRCTFQDNSAGATVFGGGPGGAIHSFGPSLEITDSSFIDNTGEANGGAISVNGITPGVSVTILRTSFSGNALDSFGTQPLHGGAIAIQFAKVLISECRFVANLVPVASAGYAGLGGAVYLADAPVQITNCIFAGNRAPTNLALLLDGLGGGVYSLRSDPIVTNCLFTGNTAGSGAGYCSRDETAGFFHCTVANNASDFLFMSFTANEVGINAGGGTASHPFTLSNCILWGNTDALGATTEDVQFSAFSSLVVPDHCCIQELSGLLGGVGNIAGNPRFADEDGADLQVGTLDDDLHLRIISPCIDAGTGAGQPADGADLDCDGDIAEAVPLDLDLTARAADTLVVVDTGVGPAPVTDLGAYESSAWKNLGHSLAGTLGSPCLVGTGTLAAASSFALSVSNVLPGASGYFVVGAATLNAPFKGGIMVPNPNSPGFAVGLALGASGQLSLGGTWPPGVPSNFRVYFQWWIVDAGGPLKFAASNAVSATAP